MFERIKTFENLKNDIFRTIPNRCKLREKIRILIIDDNEVQYIDALKRLSYNITYMSDIENIRDVEPYQIIICDIKGVGLKLSPEKEGVAIIQNIVKLYPEKGIIAYSGGTFDIGLSAIFSLADDTIQKGLDAADISEKIDVVINKVIDPKRLWNEINSQLIKSNIRKKDIKKIESMYIASLSVKDVTKFSEYIIKMALDIDVPKVINAVCALIGRYKALC